MNVFDDADYFYVDNLPAGIVRSLASRSSRGSKVERASSSPTSRRDCFEEIVAVFDELDPDRGFTRVVSSRPTRTRC